MAVACKLCQLVFVPLRGCHVLSYDFVLEVVISAPVAAVGWHMLGHPFVVPFLKCTVRSHVDTSV